MNYTLKVTTWEKQFSAEGTIKNSYSRKSYFSRVAIMF